MRYNHSEVRSEIFSTENDGGERSLTLSLLFYKCLAYKKHSWMYVYVYVYVGDATPIAVA